MLRPIVWIASTLSTLAVIVCLGVGLGATDASYQQSVEKWRQDYDAKLRADDGWLAVAGLFWLHEGQNTFGSAAGNDIVMQSPSLPAKAGYFDLHASKTVVHVNSGVSITMGGKPVDTAELRPDSKVDRLAIDDLSFYVHASGGRFAIRLRDKNSKLRKEFKGPHWYPVDPAFRLTAQYVAYPAPRKVEIENILGDRGPTY
ncbi:MAG TPA: hypothetical protein VH724_07320, partial [Candidatus Angelobacter sp.]|nr:hypothetical protein [Candidatus Angelobacter sp.]